MLFTPEELGWDKEFVKTLKEMVLESKWTALLHHLAMRSVELPGHCTCSLVLDGPVYHAAQHAEYNLRIRAAIMSSGARIGMYKALYREVAGVPLTPEQEEECPNWSSMRNGKQLLDFLLAGPKLAWFKKQHDQKKMYQGGALDHQERNPGLTN